MKTLQEILFNETYKVKVKSGESTIFARVFCKSESMNFVGYRWFDVLNWSEGFLRSTPEEFLNTYERL